MSLFAAAVFFAPACALVSGLDGLERASAATESGGDAGIDTGRPVAYVDLVLADTPIAYYRLDETSGSVVTSDVTGAPNGSFTRGVTPGHREPRHQAAFEPRRHLCAVGAKRQ